MRTQGLEEKGNLKQGFSQTLDCFILKEVEGLERKWVLQIGKSRINIKAAEAKPVSFRSSSLIQLKELIHCLIKMYGAWEVLNLIQSPVAEKDKIKSEELYAMIDSHYRSLSEEMKRSFKDGYILGLEETKVKVV
jgi:hypothetical protein